MRMPSRRDLFAVIRSMLSVVGGDSDLAEMDMCHTAAAGPFRLIVRFVGDEEKPLEEEELDMVAEDISTQIWERMKAADRYDLTPFYAYFDALQKELAKDVD